MVTRRQKPVTKTRMQTEKRTPLKGHAHPPLPGEQRAGKTDPHSELKLTLVMRRRHELPDLHPLGAKSIHHREHLTREDLSRRHGAVTGDLAVVRRFARKHHLEIGEVDLARRTVELCGKAHDVEKAFAVTLVEMSHPRGNYRRAMGRGGIPDALAGVVESVLGLSTRHCARRCRVHHSNTLQPFWTVPQMARAYGFPRSLHAQGQSIALVELGGGFHKDDLRKYFARLRRPMPRIRVVSVGGAKNDPAPVSDIKMLLDVIAGKRKLSDCPQDAMAAAQATLEVTMDIELVAALAPGAEIVVYMAPPTEQGIYHAVSRALRGGKKLPCAISISWGEPETGVSRAYLTTVDEALRDAAMLGVTVCVSSGDEGAMNGATDGKPVVNFPASSPHVLSCGGSSVHVAENSELHEAAWNCTLHGMHGATGGGVSRHFAPPAWQKEHNVPLGPTGRRGRGVPDVAGPADPHQGCEILAGGRRCSSAGTSAVAPLWAALIACLSNHFDKRCGYLTPLLYRHAAQGSQSLRVITRGNNGFYEAAEGWNACTGLGSPVVGHLLETLREHGPGRLA
jgi:kumamolisin